MPKSLRAVVCAAGCAFMAASPVYAQRDWTTIGNDAQRSSWLRNDAKISPDSLRKPGFQLVWKVKLKGSPTPPALLDFYIGYRGFRSLGFVGGSGDTLTAMDTDLARIEWEKSFAPPSAAPAASLPCPGGMTSSVARPTSAGYPAATAFRGFGRGGPAKSGVGEPLQGAVTLKEAPVQFTPPPPAPAKPGRTAPPPNPFARGPQYIHAVAADGKFHSLYVSNGEEPNPPVPFLPPNANAVGLIVFDNTAYVATANGCGGAENGVWALDLESKRVTQWKSGAAGVAGSAGPAAGPDGTLYVAAGSQLVALEPGTLQQKQSYSAGPQVFTSSPVVFEFKGKDLIAAATNDGRIHLLDGAALGGQTPLARTPAHSSTNVAAGAGALASWQDAGGTRWVLAPAAAAVIAWKVVEKDGGPAFEPGWVSRDMVSPLAPAIVNGVVFAVSSAPRSSKAVLYALDGATGKELWSSGDTITSFVHSGGLAAGGSRVYVGGQDGTQYAFGFPMEH